MARQVTLDTLTVSRVELRINENDEMDVLLAYVVHSGADPGLRIPGELEVPSADLTPGERGALQGLINRLRVSIEQREGL